MLSPSKNQELCLQKIINSLLHKDVWPVTADDFETIKYRLAGYPGDQLYKKYLYANEIYKICLKDIGPFPLEAISQFDDLLGLSGKRRHFNHSFEVFMLGLIIMQNCKNKDLFIVPDDPKDPKAPKVPKAPLSDPWRPQFFTWLLSAAAHDFGYPLEQSAKIVEYIADMYFRIDANRVSDKFKSINTKKFLVTEDSLYRQFIRQSDYEMKVYDLEKIIKDSLSLSVADDVVEANLAEAYQQNKSGDVHGFVSALLLARQAIHYAFDHKISFGVLKRSLGAVMIHSLKLGNDPNKPEGLLYKIDARKNAYAYLLTILDSVQDWDRNYLYALDKFPTYVLDTFDVDLDTSPPRMKLKFLVNAFPEQSVPEAVKAIKEKGALTDLAKNHLGFTLEIEYEFRSTERLLLKYKSDIETTKPPIILAL